MFVTTQEELNPLLTASMMPTNNNLVGFNEFFSHENGGVMLYLHTINNIAVAIISENDTHEELRSFLENFHDNNGKVLEPTQNNLQNAWIDNYFFLKNRNTFIDKRSGASFSCLSFDKRCCHLVPTVNRARDNADHYVFDHGIMIADKDEHLQGEKEMFLYKSGSIIYNTAFDFGQVRKCC